jgi:MFS family permease
VIPPQPLRPLFAGRFIRSLTQATLGIVVPLYLLALGYGPAAAGMLIAVGAGASAVLTLAVGWLADRIGRKPILVIFGVLTAAGSVVFALRPPFALLVVASALGTIGQGGGVASGGAFGPYYPAEQALIAELAGDARRTAVFAGLSLVGAVGGVLGSLCAGLPRLLMQTGWQHGDAYAAMFWLSTLGGIALALVVLPIREKRPQRTVLLRSRRLAPRTRGLIARFMLTNATNGLAVGYLGPIMVIWFHARFGVNSAQIAALYAAINIASIVPYLGVTRAVRLLGGAVRMVVVLRITACALLMAIPFAPTFVLAGVGYLIRMLINIMTMPVRQSYVMGIIPESERSRAAALSNLPSRLGAMVGPATAGPMIESGLTSLPLELAAALQLVNAALYWTFFRGVMPPEEKTPPEGSMQAEEA